MQLEFIDVPGRETELIEVPRGWVGTTVTVRANVGAGPVLYALGVRPGAGRIAHGIFQPWNDRAIVVVHGTAYEVRDEGRAEIAVRALKQWPVKEVVEGPSCVALVTSWVVEVHEADDAVTTIAETDDGIRNVRITSDAVEGEGWVAGEWRRFSRRRTGRAQRPQ